MRNKMEQTIAKECLAYIDQSVSCYHAVETAAEKLKEAGFEEISEKASWKLEKGGAYYVKRGESSLIAFRLPKQDPTGYHVVATHSDSPSFKLKSQYELESSGYIRLNTEGYGGMIYATWFDRPLSLAGRVVFEDQGELHSVNVNVDEDLLVIPSLAIHMNREVNKGVEWNPQVDLLPLMGGGDAKGYLEKKLLEFTGGKEILGKDLYLYVREKGRFAGADGNFLLSPRLDDLSCVYAALKAILTRKPKDYCSVCAVFNNEEVGSLTRQGAASTFLKDVLMRICYALGGSESEYLQLIADSFMISADNAHALHPAHPEKADPGNRPVLNGGIVIKHHGGQKYTTDAYTEGGMKSLCRQAQVPFQDYHNRSDVAGGSTLGNLAMAQAAIKAVDIGLPQLAMHSAVETAGSRDVEDLVKVLQVFCEK